MVTVPQWGPDGYSRDMAVASACRANPASACSNGIGITNTQQQTDAFMAPRQNFRGLAAAIRQPSVKNLPDSGSLPDASAQVDPILLTLSANQLGRL
jgi:hypothetical protein